MTVKTNKMHENVGIGQKSVQDSDLREWKSLSWALQLSQFIAYDCPTYRQALCKECENQQEPSSPWIEEAGKPKWLEFAEQSDRKESCFIKRQLQRQRELWKSGQGFPQVLGCVQNMCMYMRRLLKAREGVSGKELPEQSLVITKRE